MKSRNHDSMMQYLFGMHEDHYVNSRTVEQSESLREALEAILTITREEAKTESHNSSNFPDRWPEEDPDGIKYRVNLILHLISSRTGTGSVENFLRSNGQLGRTEYVAVRKWDTSRTKAGYSRGSSMTQVMYHIDDLPDQYKVREHPYCVSYSGGQTCVLPVYTFGIGD